MNHIFQSHRIAALLFLLVILLTVADVAIRHGWFVQAAIVFLVLFIALEWTRVPQTQQKVSLVLLTVGCVTAVVSGQFFATLLAGLERTLPFLLIFASVSWLQLPSSQSPSLLAVREAAMRQPPGRRFLSVALTAHFIGASFNLAGLVLMSPMLHKGIDDNLKKRLARAMMWGFGACTCWSPFIVGVVVIVKTVPGVSWMELWKTGFLLAALLLTVGWVMDKVISSHEVFQKSSEPVTPLNALIWARVVMILLSLFACVLLMVEVLKWTIPIALVMTAPIYALAWAYFIHRSGDGIGPGETLRKAVSGFTSLRGETLLFASGNIMGMGISPLLPKELITEFFTQLNFPPAIYIGAMMLVSGLLSAVGVHPLVSVILITTVVSPEMIGVSPSVMALALMVMWGQGTSISPVSATTLFMSRNLNIPSWVIGWQWNGLYIVISTLIVVAALSALVATGLL